jgi:hypothetical protein
MNYPEFCQSLQVPLTAKEMASTDEVEPATAQEIQWLKSWQVKRAIKHKGAGNPTRADLELLENKTGIVVSIDDYRAVRAKEKAADRENADIYFPLNSFQALSE